MTVWMIVPDRVGNVPPCVVCGSCIVKKHELKIDLYGNWKGRWVCENDHENIFR